MAEICKDINKLTPETKILCLRFLELCKAQGLNIKITETWRSEERQKELIKSGASKINHSLHQDGRAFDYCQNVKGDLYPDTIMRKCGAIGKSLGLYWGGSFQNFYDSCHLQNDKPVGTIKAVSDEYIKAVDKLVQGGIISSPIIWKEKKFTKDNVEDLIVKFASKL